MNLESMTPFIILPLVYATKGIDFSLGDRLLYLRIAFGILQLIAMAIRFLVRSRIVAAGDLTEITVPVPAAPLTGEPETTKKNSIFEYDMTQWKQEFQQSIIGLLIIGGIHYKWGYAVPLMTQLVLTPLKLYGSKLVKAHFLGADVPRPFPKPPSAFGDLMKNLAGEPEENKPKKKKKDSKTVDPITSKKKKQ